MLLQLDPMRIAIVSVQLLMERMVPEMEWPIMPELNVTATNLNANALSTEGIWVQALSADICSARWSVLEQNMGIVSQWITRRVGWP